MPNQAWRTFLDSGFRKSDADGWKENMQHFYFLMRCFKDVNAWSDDKWFGKGHSSFFAAVICLLITDTMNFGEYAGFGDIPFVPKDMADDGTTAIPRSQMIQKDRRYVASI